TLREMADNLTAAASLFPSGAHLDCVAYACTSGTAEIGAARISELVRDGVETPAVTDPVSALVSACRALDVTRLALLSPYVANVSDRLREVLEGAGITVTNLVSFKEPDEARVVRIDENSIHDAALKCVEQAPCDAVFLSCTNLRTLDVLPRIETATGLPVLSSNLVLAWHMLRLSGRALAPNVPCRLATPGATQGESSR
ncbi:MAG: Asp/Glu racemase, partial [Tateyamaria sp.]